MKFKLIVLLYAIAPLYSATITSLIDSPGQYFYAADMFANPVDADDAIITVSSDQVIVDFSDYLMTQSSSNQVGGLVGIRILPNHKYIEIRNARINGLTGSGIEIQEGCDSITIDNINISACDAGGMVINGVSSNPITNLFIQNSYIYSCTGAQGAPAYGLQLNWVDDLTMNNCSIIGNDASSTSSGYGMFIQNSMEFTVLNSLFNDNGGYQEAAGVYIESSTQIFLENCRINLNSAQSSDAASFGAGVEMRYCADCHIIACETIGNKNLVARGHGIKSEGGSSNVIQGSIIEDNYGGIRTFGIEMINGTKGQIINNKIRDNSSPLMAYGIRLTGTCLNCQITNNEISNNSAPTSFALLDQTNPSTSAIYQNSAFNHSTNYSVAYPSGIVLARIQGSLSNSVIGLPSNTGGVFDNIDLQP